MHVLGSEKIGVAQNSHKLDRFRAKSSKNVQVKVFSTYVRVPQIVLDQIRNIHLHSTRPVLLQAVQLEALL